PAPRFGFGSQQIRRSAETSLRKLRTERLGALLLHEPAAEDVYDALVRLLEQLKRDGKVAAIGLAATAANTSAILSRYPNVFDIAQIPVADVGKVGHVGAGTLTIVHSVLGLRLTKSLTRAAASREGAQRFEADTGVSPADREGVARLLLRSAMARNPDGVTLFSSSRAERVKANASVKPLDAVTAAHIATLLGE
ncbi:MAG: aldo/keto reductase, partial [Phycisphaerales bacterium]|nr:aldo/keto reductase [Hyphomonadaceae bacterium]